jgi:hypothetical protein
MRIAIVLALAACSGPTPKAPIVVAPPAPGPGALAEKPYFRVDPGPMTACASGATCEARVVLTARAGYHVNPEYPYKFVADPSADLAIDGTGTFTVDDPLHGTMTITFRPAKAGTHTLSGTFKLSVCSADECAIDAPKIALTVPAS